MESGSVDVLNIIVKHSKPVSWDKVVEIQKRRENDRREWFNRGGLERLHARTAKIAKALEENGRKNVLVFDRQFDGLMMDQCRELCGTTDWKKHKSYLQWVLRQPEQAAVTANQKQQLERLIHEADESCCTPSYTFDQDIEKQRQSDLSKLPAQYRRGLE